jgi:hypothetical protein
MLTENLYFIVPYKKKVVYLTLRFLWQLLKKNGKVDLCYVISVHHCICYTFFGKELVHFALFTFYAPLEEFRSVRVAHCSVSDDSQKYAIAS